MFQNKYVVTGVLVGILTVSGAGFWLWHSHQGGQTQLDDGAASENVLASETQAASTPGGLGVSQSSSASNLGQINPTQNQNSSSSASGSSGSSSSPTTPDPSTFAQYEKYKDGTTALFGDVQVGDGATLGANQKAAVYYKGWLTNGQMFDESRPGSDGKLQPFVFTLGAHQVIPGWEQGLAGMKVGGTRLVIVPPAVGYGDAGQGSIPGNAVLVFVVQLLAVQ